MGQALDLLIATNLKRKQQASDVSGGVASLSKTLQGVQKMKQQRRQNQINELLASAKIREANTNAANTSLQAVLLNQALNRGDGQGTGSGASLASFGPSGPTFDFTTKDEQLDRVFKLQDQFTKRPENQDFTEIRNRVSQMDALLKAADQGDLRGKNALDQALISTFNKVTDPGSVVRESEFARTAQGLSLANRFRGTLQKLAEGGAGLTSEDRRELVIAAKIIANDRGKSFNKGIEGLKKRGKTFGVRSDQITSGIDSFKPFKIGGSSGSEKTFNSPDAADNSGLPKGTVVIVQGRRYRI